MVSKTSSAVLLLGAARCAAFAPHTRRNFMPLDPDNRNPADALILSAKERSVGDLDSFLSSLPSPDAVKKNIMEGKVGERGETYVIAQFGLLLLIAIGTIPVVGNVLTSLLGPSLIAAGLFVVYKAAADLEDNLSPWPVPADPKSGRGSLVRGGIYEYVRHPMYAGLLCGMTGLSLLTDSVTRLLLTGGLYLVLDAKSDYEEEKLVDAYGSEYEGYRREVQGKFLPPDMDVADLDGFFMFF